VPLCADMLELVIRDDGSERAVPPEAGDDVQEWWEQGRICAYGYRACGENWLHVPGIATYRFRGVNEPVVAVPSGADRGLVVDGFERTVLPMALQALGREVLHASAVLTPAGVVALCGDSEAGKSTLAHVLTLRGYQPWADDAVTFETSDEGAFALPLPFRINLRSASVSSFGAPAAVEPTKTRRRERLAAAVVLVREPAPGTRVSVRRLSSAEAFRALLSQGYAFQPDDQERNSGTVSEYLDLAAAITVFEARVDSYLANVRRLADRVEKIVISRLTVTS
jgi:hypothetical protein